MCPEKATVKQAPPPILNAEAGGLQTLFSEMPHWLLSIATPFPVEMPDLEGDG